MGVRAFFERGIFSVNMPVSLFTTPYVFGKRWVLHAVGEPLLLVQRIDSSRASDAWAFGPHVLGPEGSVRYA